MSNSQINLPKTAFSMKANLPTREPEILKFWEKINLYQELRNSRKGEEKFVLHSMIDRFWLKYQKDKIEISVGRQRVNWGVNTIWNNNDLFNAYNFIDFDYIERPGSDVIRFIYTGDNLSSFELVYLPSERKGYSLAGLYKLNSFGYDFQILAANYFEDIVIGGGWAGNIKNAGFKGELSYFVDKENIKNSLSFSTSVDYSTKNGFYFSSFNGDFRIEDGNIFTTNLLIKGPSAELLTVGTTNFIEETYDMQVIASPEFGETLPAIALLGGPITAAATFAAEKLAKAFGRDINDLIKIKYKVTGTWDDPKIKIINKKTDALDDVEELFE